MRTPYLIVSNVLSGKIQEPVIRKVFFANYTSQKIICRVHLIRYVSRYDDVTVIALKPVDDVSYRFTVGNSILNGSKPERCIDLHIQLRINRKNLFVCFEGIGDQTSYLGIQKAQILRHLSVAYSCPVKFRNYIIGIGKTCIIVFRQYIFV